MHIALGPDATTGTVDEVNELIGSLDAAPAV
jgi:hypothetical protein